MQQIWIGTVNGYKVRIIQSPGAGCIVEAFDMQNWTAVDDDALAAEVYLAAFLEARQALSAIRVIALDFHTKSV